MDTDMSQDIPVDRLLLFRSRIIYVSTLLLRDDELSPYWNFLSSLLIRRVTRLEIRTTWTNRWNILFTSPDLLYRCPTSMTEPTNKSLDLPLSNLQVLVPPDLFSIQVLTYPQLHILERSFTVFSTHIKYRGKGVVGVRGFDCSRSESLSDMVPVVSRGRTV